MVDRVDLLADGEAPPRSHGRVVRPDIEPRAGVWVERPQARVGKGATPRGCSVVVGQVSKVVEEPGKDLEAVFGRLGRGVCG